MYVLINYVRPVFCLSFWTDLLEIGLVSSLVSDSVKTFYLGNIHVFLPTPSETWCIIIIFTSISWLHVIS